MVELSHGIKYKSKDQAIIEEENIEKTIRWIDKTKELKGNHKNRCQE